MKKYTQEELQEILENHKHWLKEDCDNREATRADLKFADLRSADLRGADLKYADLIGANLSGTDLSGTDLSGTDLRFADLRDTVLRGADLLCAVLRFADLSGADLSGADLSGADLRKTVLNGTDLSNANLRWADLRDTVLRDTDLRGADLRDTVLRGADLRGARNTPFIPQTCPEEGSFIGYKKASGCIVKLEILADARRCSATGRVCRCDKARVLDIQNINIDEPCELTEVASSYDNSFVYRIGEVVEEPEFDEDRWNKCSKGIYFFINRQEAVKS